VLNPPRRQYTSPTERLRIRRELPAVSSEHAADLLGDAGAAELPEHRTTGTPNYGPSGHRTENNEDYAKASLKKYRPIAARNEDKKVFNGLL